MAQPRRKCRLVNSSLKGKVDLRQYEQIIIDTVNSTIPNKNPKVFKDYFSTDPLTQSESVALGRALAKIPALNSLGKTITTFRLFDGRTYDNEEAPSRTSSGDKSDAKNTLKGGRMI